MTTDIQGLLSSESDQHFTPPEIVEPARETMGGIDFDPFSCALANSIVKARTYYSLEANEDGFMLPWKWRALVNPPGGKGGESGNESSQGRAWVSLMRHYADVHDKLEMAIFVCFNMGLLQTTQGKGVTSPLRFPICYPSKRISYLTPNLPGPTEKRPNRKPTLQQKRDHELTGMCRGESPPQASCVVFVPPRIIVAGPVAREAAISRFVRAFSPVGEVVVPDLRSRNHSHAIEAELGQ